MDMKSVYARGLLPSFSCENATSLPEGGVRMPSLCQQNYHSLDLLVLFVVSSIALRNNVAKNESSGA